MGKAIVFVKSYFLFPKELILINQPPKKIKNIENGIVPMMNFGNYLLMPMMCLSLMEGLD